LELGELRREHADGLATEMVMRSARLNSRKMGIVSSVQIDTVEGGFPFAINNIPLVPVAAHW
jgi:hypothetical protein